MSYKPQKKSQCSLRLLNPKVLLPMVNISDLIKKFWLLNYNKILAYMHHDMALELGKHYNNLPSGSKEIFWEKYKIIFHEEDGGWFATKPCILKCKM
jgi:hypothetical protein